jgi:hypothetical protein
VPDLFIELLWSVGVPLGMGGLFALAAMSLLKPRPPKPPEPPEHEGATEDWSPTGEYASLAPLNADDAELHEELHAIEQRMHADLQWVQAAADEWLGRDELDPRDELALLGLGDTCGFQRDPITGQFRLVPIGSPR